MEQIYNLIKTDLYLDICIALGIMIIITILSIMISNKRKRNKIKEEFEEATEIQVELEKTDDKNSELEDIIKKMQEDAEIKPEDVVKKFEEEQEENAIISYKELVDSVKTGKIETIEDEVSDVNFVEELTNSEVEPILEIENNEEKVTPEMVKEAINDISLNSIKEEKKKFKQSEFISPVYGIMEDKLEYPTVKKQDNMVDIMNTRDYNELTEEIKRQEEFLRALIEFKNNL